jgi:hypothetical protein
MSVSEERDIVVNNYYLSQPSEAPPSAGVILVSFDVETTGGRLAKNAMVELGAVAKSAADDDDTEKRVLTTFEGIMKIPEGRGWEERCEREFWDNPENNLAAKKKRINECQTEPDDVMRAFVNWIENNVLTFLAGGDPRRVRFVTDNAAFDPSWVNLYLDLYADHEPLHTFFTHDGVFRYAPIIDTNGVARGISGCTVDDEFVAQLKVDADGRPGWFSATGAARRLLGIPDSVKSQTVHDHRSVHDAQHILESYQIMMRWNKKRAVRDSVA